jgi:hypothetical protein
VIADAPVAAFPAMRRDDLSAAIDRGVVVLAIFPALPSRRGDDMIASNQKGSRHSECNGRD